MFLNEAFTETHIYPLCSLSLKVEGMATGQKKKNSHRNNPKKDTQMRVDTVHNIKKDNGHKQQMEGPPKWTYTRVPMCPVTPGNPEDGWTIFTRRA